MNLPSNIYFRIFCITSFLLLLYAIADSLYVSNQFDPLNMGIKDYLKSFEKGMIISSVRVRESKWTILSIENKEGIIPRTNNIKYAYQLRMVVDNTLNWRYEYFPKNLPVYLPDGLIYRKGEISDLRPGDKVLLKARYHYDTTGKNKVIVNDVTLTKIP